LPPKKRLLVEDSDQQFAIAELMKNFVPDWGIDRTTWKVTIQVCNGASNVLSRPALNASIKEEGMEALGIIVDANDSFQGR